MTTKLLHYNSRVIAHPDNHHFPGVARFSQFFKIYNPLAVVVDRTGTITTPIQMKNLFPMPQFRKMNKSFEEICNGRALELLTRADVLDVDLHVFYSGGIDSTLLLISLLKNATPEQKSRIVVLLSGESITENPNFYKGFIHGKLRTNSVNMFPYLLGAKHMFIGGEHNDQIFGSDMMGKLISKFGSSIINQPYSRDTFFALFNERIDDVIGANFYLDLFEQLKDAAPVEIITNQDYLWWINFSTKWQTVFLRVLPRVSSRNAPYINSSYLGTYYDQFYNTEDFQLWSMNNMDKKIKDQWNTYKWVCKDIIYDYTKDAEYRDNKIKHGSLYSILTQQNSFNFIDESMNFMNEMDPQDYINPHNDFV